ncbi:phage portal protein [Streptomyces sp. WAC07149]|uniref:phage portal protein n=1 Tax=Streptomyces sp. WAC07149 TaxID=2487425 RepID=UPI000F7742DE|nr:phage portal protein [Streptomyces sp. WAC07149]RST07910.1 phage portal protein [Streptomyces sp. WAC07149]
MADALDPNLPINITDIDERIRQSLKMIERDFKRLNTVDQYVRGLHASPYTPRRSNPEFKELVRRSFHNIIPLLVDAPSNALSVEGYRRPDVTGNPPEWTFWQSNRMDQRQGLVHRSAIESGQAYVTVTPADPKKRPGVDPKMPEIRTYPAIRMFAGYDDPIFDAFPLYALFIENNVYSDKEPTRGKFFDDKFVYDLTIGKGYTIDGKRPHGLGVCPVVRFTPKLDLMGRSQGMVEGIIRYQDKLNQMWLSLLIAQHYTGFAIRTATGLSPVERVDENGMPILDEEGQPTYIPPVLDPSTMLVSPNPDTQFGQLPSAPTKDFLDAIELLTRHMCAVTETPPHYLLSGKLANLSADALAAAESAFTRKIDEIRHSFGESWELVLRLCALVSGDQTGFEIQDAEVQWADKGNRSLAQAVDAGLKLSQMGVPVDLVLTKIPGFTQQDVDLVRERLEQAPSTEAEPPGDTTSPMPPRPTLSGADHKKPPAATAKAKSQPEETVKNGQQAAAVR